MYCKQDIVNALQSGAHSSRHAKSIAKLSDDIPDALPSYSNLSDVIRDKILRLAGICRCSRAVKNILMSGSQSQSVTEYDTTPEFDDLLYRAYYPVLEDGRASVRFWCVNTNRIITSQDVHEWVRDTAIDKKTGKLLKIVVPFHSYWCKHIPDYDIYGVCFDRAKWREPTVSTDTGTVCVNTAFNRTPVRETAPDGYVKSEAEAALDLILESVITDPDPVNATMKRDKFVLDVGSHMLSLRDGGSFRCRKVFCFTSTNNGQGTGKTFLHEAIASLAPRDGVCVVPTTSLAGNNLLPIYSSIVTILTEAPATSDERYTAEDVKAFADAGWKTAEEKYVAKRQVYDNSVKLLSSNHLSPLPIDSANSRRVEYFVSRECDDGGLSIRMELDKRQTAMGVDGDGLRACVGWALLERARDMLMNGSVPSEYARRTIDSKHILSEYDYEYFVNEQGNVVEDYKGYRSWRGDRGCTWSYDMLRYRRQFCLSKSVEKWIDSVLPKPPPPPTQKPKHPLQIQSVTVQNSVAKKQGMRIKIPSSSQSVQISPAPEQQPLNTNPTMCSVPGQGNSSKDPKFVGCSEIQYKPKMRTAWLAKDSYTLSGIIDLVRGNGIKDATESVRKGTGDKRESLPQIFPSARFSRMTRRENITGYTGIIHVDYDKVSVNTSGKMTAETLRDAISSANIKGFLMSGVSASGNGVWALFYAGDRVNDLDTFSSATKALYEECDAIAGFESDRATSKPTLGRLLAYDPDIRFNPSIQNGILPDPFEWKESKYATVSRMPKPVIRRERTKDERVRDERFMEVVVERSCEKIRSANEQRHNTAISQIANIMKCCEERMMIPLTTWKERIREACLSSGLDRSETNSIMTFWRRIDG